MVEPKNLNQTTDPNCLRLHFQQFRQQSQAPRSTTRQVCDAVISLMHSGQEELAVEEEVN
jgi:hypothetical protein